MILRGYGAPVARDPDEVKQLDAHSLAHPRAGQPGTTDIAGYLRVLAPAEWLP
jgi:hypothetical protein